MTKTEFRRNVEWGLGRALLFLRSAPRPERMRDVLWQFYTGEEKRAFTPYDNELIACLPDADAFRQQLYDLFAPDVFSWTMRERFRLLQNLGFSARLQKSAEEMYAEHLRNLRDALQRNADAGEITERARKYGFLCSVRLFWFSAEDDEFRTVIRDTVSLFDEGDAVPPEAEGHLLHVFSGVILREKTVLLEELADDRPIWRKIREMEPTPIYLSCHAEPIPSLTIAQVLGMTEEELDAPVPGESNTLFGRVRASFPYMSEEDVRTAAEVSLSDPDPRRRNRMMRLFLPTPDILHPPAFPLSPEGLISLAESQRNLPPAKRTPDFWSALSVLCQMKHEAVREYGEKLLEAYPYGRTTMDRQGLRSTAIQMVYDLNYRSSDREPFAAMVQENRSWEYNACRYVFLDKLMRGDADLPMECVPALFCSHPNYRYSLVKTLLSRGELPDCLSLECRYDSNPEIRRLVKAHMSEHK